MTSETITVRVPGSTSNIGPGFDCMGIALQVYNEIRVARSLEGTTPVHPMAEETARCFFEAVALPAFPFSWAISGNVPMSRGLGSSVTLRQGLLQGLNELAGRPCDRERLFHLGAALEGHPDNASAGVFGGFTCSNAAGNLHCFPVDERLKFVLLIPDREVLTEEARRCLPEVLLRRDAVRGMGDACAITAAFASGAYEKLRGCFNDVFHQPYRKEVNPGLVEVIAAGEQSGALGGFLSGSGSTMACLTLADPEAVQRAMLQAYEPFGNASGMILEADNAGAQTVSA